MRLCCCGAQPFYDGVSALEKADRVDIKNTCRERGITWLICSKL